MSAYFRQVQVDAWHATSSAGSFVAAVMRNSNGLWRVSTDRSTDKANASNVHLNDASLEEAFHYVNSHLIGVVVVK